MTCPVELGVRLNWLRAGVLGANDGVVSVASLMLGVVGAAADRSVVLTAGLAGLFAGAMAMAVGEYVSVSAQRDTERALLNQEHQCERWTRGLTNPWHAALASFLAFVTGALLPLLAIALSPEPARVAAAAVVSLALLAATGVVSAWLGSASRLRAVVRNVVGGAVAMGVTYGIGSLAGTVV